MIYMQHVTFIRLCSFSKRGKWNGERSKKTENTVGELINIEMKIHGDLIHKKNK